MKNNLLYSKNKILRHLKKLDQLKRRELIPPVLARIDVTNACNHNCVYCMYRKSLPEFGLCDSFSFNDQIPEKKLKNLLIQLKKIGVKAIMFAGGGEPTIYPNFKKIVEFSLKEGFEVGIITNGAGLNNSWLDLVKHKKFKWIRISLDASNERTWAKIHRPNNGNSFNEIIQVVKFLKSKKINAQIGASFVINDLNWSEIIDFTKLCKKNNFDDVRISFTYQIKREKLYSEHKEEILSSLNQSKKFSDKKFYVSILKDRLESLENKEKNYKKCYFSYLSISVGANLKLYPCCMTKYAKKYCIADLNKERIDKSFLKKWIKFIGNIKVKKCPTCWYDSFNEMGNYYLDKKVEFENFIN